MMSKLTTIALMIMLAGCGQGTSTSGGESFQDIQSRVCTPLLQECSFNGNQEGCKAIKKKKKPEQALIDQNNFNAFMCSSYGV